MVRAIDCTITLIILDLSTLHSTVQHSRTILEPPFLKHRISLLHNLRHPQSLGI